jgi:hypothetical protein
MDAYSQLLQNLVLLSGGRRPLIDEVGVRFKIDRKVGEICLSFWA